MTDDLPTPTPTITPETERFWEATAEGDLLLKRCRSCDAAHYYPRARCPHCFSDDTEWIEAEGDGTVYAFTVCRQIQHSEAGYDEAVPFVVAYVELSEGPKMLTNVVGCDPEDVETGQPVTVVFDDTGDGVALPRFRPA